MANEGKLPKGDGHMNIILTHVGLCMAAHYMGTEVLDYIHGFMITM